MCFLISIFLCFALVPKLVPRTVDFHWYWYRILKFWYRDNTSIDVKSLMLPYKALNNLAPQYLSEPLTPYTPTCVLRSSEAGLLTVQTTLLTTMGDRALSSLAPKLWNSLPSEIRNAESLSVFKLSLKTYFKCSFYVITLFYYIGFVLFDCFFTACTFVCIFLLHICICM